MLAAALTGFVLGFVTSIPVAGPISILVFSRGLEDRQRSGVFLAMGAAVAESVYAYLAFWGFSELLLMYPWIEPISRGLAAVLLTALGARFALKGPSGPPAEGQSPKTGSKRNFLLGFTITALNPTLLATWPALMTLVHSLEIVTFSSSRALPFSIGVCLGISIWFAVLLALLQRFKGRLRSSTLDAIVRVMGIALIGLGLYFAVRLIQYLISRT